MKRIFLLAWVGLSLCGFGSAETSNALPEGVWEGSIQLPGGQELEIAVTLAEDEAGAWAGSIDIPAQRLAGYALSEVAVEGQRARFAMQGIPGTPRFDGQYDPEARRIAGEFSQGPQRLEFAMDYRGPAELENAEQSAEPEPAEGVPGEGVVGEWLGSVSFGHVPLRLAVHVRRGEDGELQGSLDSLDQGAMGLEFDRVEFQPPEFSFGIDRIGGSYSGKRNEDGSQILGTWSQGGVSVPLNLRRVAEPVTLKRPQEPKPPFPYEVREVTFRNEADDVTLAGSYVIPEGEGPFPAAVFVSGSGAQDRDEALMGHRPFAVIADALARRGIASLRYDDRGFAKSTGDHLGSTTVDFAEDAMAGMRFLEKQAEIDGDALGMIGHSEGGLIATIAEAKFGGTDFLIMLAPPAERLDALLLRQHQEVWRLAGVDEALIERATEGSAQEMKLIVDESLDTEALVAKLRALRQQMESELDADELATLGVDEAAFDSALKLVTSNWFRSLMRIDPVDYLSQAQAPALVMFGEKDVQVNPEVNAPLAREAFRRAGNEQATIEVVKGVNHLFQEADTGGLDEYGLIEQTIAPRALERIGAWIIERSK